VCYSILPSCNPTCVMPASRELPASTRPPPLSGCNEPCLAQVCGLRPVYWQPYAPEEIATIACHACRCLLPGGQASGSQDDATRVMDAPSAYRWSALAGAPPSKVTSLAFRTAGCRTASLAIVSGYPEVKDGEVPKSTGFYRSAKGKCWHAASALWQRVAGMERGRPACGPKPVQEMYARGEARNTAAVTHGRREEPGAARGGTTAP